MTSVRWIWFFCLLMILPRPLLAAEEIELMYVQRQGNPDIHDPRFFLAKVAKLVEDAFAATGDSFVWQEMPIGRIVRVIEQNDRAACAVGWYKSEERKQVGKFTTSIGEFQPMGAIARRDAGLKDYYEHITDLIFDRSKLGGTIQLSENTPSRYSSLIDQYGENASVMGFSVGIADLLRLVKIGRIHYMLISGDEADFYLSSPEWGTDFFQKIRFGNFTEAEEMALFCTTATPDQWIARFNAAVMGMRTPSS